MKKSNIAQELIKAIQKGYCGHTIKGDKLESINLPKPKELNSKLEQYYGIR